MSLPRLIVFFAVIGALAVLAPFYGPDLLARLAGADASARAPAASGPRQTALASDGRGHFLASAVIDGLTVEALVDTGATVVALNEATAKQLGIVPSADAYNHPVMTANGEVMTALVTLKSVKIGGVTVEGVPASVVPGDALGQNLLGMSFLGRLRKFEIAGGQLVLFE